jgi:hypothetical protein
MVIQEPVSETPEKLKCLLAASAYYLCKEKNVET